MAKIIPLCVEFTFIIFLVVNLPLPARLLMVNDHIYLVFAGKLPKLHSIVLSFDTYCYRTITVIYYHQIKVKDSTQYWDLKQKELKYVF